MRVVHRRFMVGGLDGHNGTSRVPNIERFN